MLTLTQENLSSEETQQHADSNWGLVLAQMKEIIESSVN